LSSRVYDGIIVALVYRVFSVKIKLRTIIRVNFERKKILLVII
jgi:hypothetical protein